MDISKCIDGSIILIISLLAAQSLHHDVQTNKVSLGIYYFIHLFFYVANSIRSCMLQNIKDHQQIYTMFPSTQRRGSLQDLRSHKTTLAFTTEKRLPPISENRELKKHVTKQLTQAVTKFTNNNRKQAMRHTEEMLRSSIFVLKAFSSVQNNFQSLFEELHQVFRRFCFTVDDSEILNVLSSYRIRQGYSYRKTLLMMDEQLENQMKEKNDKIQELSNSIRNLQQKSEQNDKAWKEERIHLQAQVERYKQLTNQQYMESLEEIVEKQKQEIQQLKNTIKHANKKNQELLEENKLNADTIHEFTVENAHLKTDVFDLSKKLDRIDSYFNDLKDKFDGLLVRMMGLKEIIAKVEAENNDLVSERARLANRAAVAFEELTPRPNYKQIFDFSVGSHINSTADIFGNILQQSTLSNKQILQKIILKKKSYKLKEADAIREKVVDDIIDSKKKMKKFQK